MHRSTARPSVRAAVRRAALTAGAVALAAAGAAPAAAGTPAGDAYRYWGYFKLSGSEWAFAQTGPDGSAPEDGSVEGYRFATAGVEDVRTPRATPSFDDLCGGTEAGDGEKRVGVVVDYGRAADGAEGAEPPEARGACAAVPEAATGADVLAAVAETRVESGLVCGIDGYPSSGCGDPVSPVPAEAAEPDEPVELTGLAAAGGQDEGAEDGATEDADENAAAADDDGPGAGLWIGLAVAAAAVVALAAAAMRRRRDILED